jgi:hypothetical protein
MAAGGYCYDGFGSRVERLKIMTTFVLRKIGFKLQ